MHRDLKPDNIMVGAFGEVYLLDWGIAIGLQPDPNGRIPDRNTHPGIVGTPLYIRYELGRGNPATASTLLGQMRDVPADLRGAVERATQEQQEEQERLRAIESQAAGTTGIFGRVVFALLYIITTLSFPFLLSLLGLERSYGLEVARNIVVAAVVLLGIGLILPALRRSQMNRGFVVMALCSPVFRMFVAMAMWRIEAPIAGLIVLTALVDALILVLGTALMDVRVLPAALVYVVAAFLAGAFPVYASPILVAGTLLVIFSLGLSWSYLYVKR